MRKIPVSNFKAKLGSMRAHLFHNPAIGLAPTLFYDITIPLEPFDSGLEWEEQPVNTEFRLEFLVFSIKDWRGFDEKSFGDISQENSDATIYLGTAHNPVFINYINFKWLEQAKLKIDCTLLCDFEFESVAEKEIVKLSTEISFKGLMIERSIIENEKIDRDNLSKVIGHLVNLNAYTLDPQIDKHCITLLPNAIRSN
jgi:hypothetical protein